MKNANSSTLADLSGTYGASRNARLIGEAKVNSEANEVPAENGSPRR